MKRTAVCLFLLQLALGASAADTVKLTRSYTEGQIEKFDETFAMVVQGGDWKIKDMRTLTVKRVYPNSQIDIEAAVTNIAINMAGQETRNDDQKSTRRVDQNGMPIDPRQPGTLDYPRTEALLFGRDLPVGQELPVEWKDAKDAKSKIKGTVKVESVKDGVAKIVSNLQIWDAKTGDSPMKVTITTTVDVATSKIQKVEGLVTNLPEDPSGGTPKQVKFTEARLP